MVKIDIGGRKQHKITELWAYCAIDTKGEGLVGYHDSTQGWVPLVGADEQRVSQYDVIAQQIATQTWKKIICKKFSKVEIVKTFTP
jgi:hypothetical protein